MLSHRCRIRSVPSSLKTLALQSGAPAIASPLPFLTAYEASHPPSARCWR